MSHSKLILILLLLLLLIYIKPLLFYTKLPKLTYSQFSKITKPITVYRTCKDTYVNEKMFKNAHQRWIELNTNINMIWYTDKDCDKFMYTQGQEIWNCYNTLRPGAFKADLFRLCILYQNGGVYVDAQTMPYVSISQMIRGCVGENLFISVLDTKKSGSGIHNGFIISSPGHPFLKSSIQRIINNVKNRDYTDNILGVTGPVCLARAINTVLERDLNSSFHEGLNEHKNISFYLFRFQWGPYQYIYKEGKVIMSKKQCTLTYFLDKMKSSSYSKMYKNKQIFA